MVYSLPHRSGFDSSKNFAGLSIILLFAVALLAAGCHPPAVTDPKDPNFIVAEKGDWHVLRGELDADVANYLKQHQQTPETFGVGKMPLLEQKMLENIVLTKLALDKAAALQLQDSDKDKIAEAAELDQLKGGVSDQEFEQQLKSAGVTVDDLKKRIHEQVLIGKVLETEAFKDVDPTEQEINAAYLAHKDSFVTPPQVRVSRILVHLDDKMTPTDKAAKKKIIDKAHDSVTHGEDFSKVAMSVSEDATSAPQGGDLGFFPQGENEPQFDEVAFNTKEGAVSPVFETPLGYQFIKVTAIQPAGVVPLSAARDQIAAYLRQTKMQQQKEAYSEKLLATGGVTIHLATVNAPPSTSGAPAPVPAK